MRDKWKAAVTICSGLALATPAFAADVIPEFIDCTPKTIFVCEAEKDDCANVPVVDVQGAYRIRVNLKRKDTQTFEGAAKISEAKIDRIERHDDLLFLHGYETARKGQRLLHGWTAIINPRTGRLTISSIADGRGFILNGNCSVVKGGEQ